MNKKTCLLFVLTSLLFAACSASATQSAEATPMPIVNADETIIAEGRIGPLRYAAIAFNVSGVVSDVLVKEGEQVKKGQTLIQLGNESDKAYATAQLELVTAQQAYDNLLNSPGTDLAQAVIDLKDAQEAYKKADNYLRYLQESKKVPQTETRVFLLQTWKGYQYQYKTRSFKGPAPQDWIIEAENDLALKEAELKEAELKLDRLKDGIDSDQLALLEARLNAAKAGVASLMVLAPFDGVVADLNAKEGESINAGGIAATIADFSGWVVKTTDLTELDVVNIREGQTVSIALDAIPDVTLNGVVESISQIFVEKQGDVVYEVTIALTDTHPSMLWGMTAVVNFEEPQD